MDGIATRRSRRRCGRSTMSCARGSVRYIGLSNFMSWQAATAVMLQEQLRLEKYVTAQMYHSLVGRGLEHEFQSFAEYHNIGTLGFEPACRRRFPLGKIQPHQPCSRRHAIRGCRFLRALRQRDGPPCRGHIKRSGRQAWRESCARGAIVGTGTDGRQQCDRRCPQSRTTRG